MATRLPNGPRIEDLRKSQGWSVPDLARASGLDPKTVRHAISGLPLLPATLAAIARSLQTTSRDILEASEAWQQPEFTFDVAISFAGEDRDVARELAQMLSAAGYRVFYDRDYHPYTMGRDLNRTLAEIYGQVSRYCIILISKHYPNKRWTEWELTWILDRISRLGDDYLLPIRIDDTQLAGLPSSLCYFDLRESTVGGFFEAFEKRA